MKIFITGVSSGIGLALTDSYLKEGASVWGVSRRRPEFQNNQLQFQTLDLSQLDLIEAALEKLFQGVSRLDCVILNAGILGQLGDLIDTSMSDLKKTMDVNLWSNKVVLDFLKRKHIILKQVVFISSGAAVRARRGWSGYSISKAALNMMVGLYAAEWPEAHFLALAPGIVDTYMQKEISEFEAGSKFPSLAEIASMRGTQDMPEPPIAVENIRRLISDAKKYPSGAFVDLRDYLHESAKLAAK